MNIPILQLPGCGQIGSNSESQIVLVRANLPIAMRPVMDFAGSPADNRIGMTLLGESLRANLGLSEESVLAAGELNKGFLWVECAPLPAGVVIKEALAMLRRLLLENYFEILLLDRREDFFRPYHQGPYSGAAAALTVEHVSAASAAFRKVQEARVALFKSIMAASAPKSPGSR